MNILKDQLLNIKALVFMSSNNYGMISPYGKQYTVTCPALQFICLPVLHLFLRNTLVSQPSFRSAINALGPCPAAVAAVGPSPPALLTQRFVKPHLAGNTLLEGPTVIQTKKTISCTQQQWQGCFFAAVLKQTKAKEEIYYLCSLSFRQTAFQNLCCFFCSILFK